MDSNELKQLVYNRISADAAIKAAIGDEFYFTINPKDTPVYPYIVYKFIAGELERDSLTKYESHIVSFVIYDNSGSTKRISEIAGLLDSVFDECEAELSGVSFTVLSVDRITPLTIIAKSDLDNWMLDVDYEIQIQIGV